MKAESSSLSRHVRRVQELPEAIGGQNHDVASPPGKDGHLMGKRKPEAPPEKPYRGYIQANGKENGNYSLFGFGANNEPPNP